MALSFLLCIVHSSLFIKEIFVFQNTTFFLTTDGILIYFLQIFSTNQFFNARGNTENNNVPM